MYNNKIQVLTRLDYYAEALYSIVIHWWIRLKATVTSCLTTHILMWSVVK